MTACQIRRYVPTLLMFAIVVYVTIDLQLQGYSSEYVFVGMFFLIPVTYYLLYDGHRWKNFEIMCNPGITNSFLRECLSCGKKQQVLYGLSVWYEKLLSDQQYELKKKEYMEGYQKRH